MMRIFINCRIANLREKIRMKFKRKNMFCSLDYIHSFLLYVPLTNFQNVTENNHSCNFNFTHYLIEFVFNFQIMESPYLSHCDELSSQIQGHTYMYGKPL